MTADTGDHADLRYAEDLTNFGATEEALDFLLLEKAFHRFLHVIDEFIDDLSSCLISTCSASAT